jgi:predicted RNA polymerase sigma factor
MVALSHAIATAMVEGRGRARTGRNARQGRAAGNHYRLDAVRAHLHEMAGNHEAAIAHYLAAAAARRAFRKRDYLSAQAARLASRTKARASESFSMKSPAECSHSSPHRMMGEGR